MRYLGSKNSIKYVLLEIMMPDILDRGVYIEPFCGSCAVIAEVPDSVRRIGSDINRYLIAALKAAQNGWVPEVLGSKEYSNLRIAAKNRLSMYPDELIGFYGCFCSFGGKWFGGLPANKNGRDYVAEQIRSLKRLSKQIATVELHCGSFDGLNIPTKSIIYCDPPYAGTTGYGHKFDSVDLHRWARRKASEGHIVYLSEYEAPNDFKLVWEDYVISTLNKNAKDYKRERLYRLV